MGKRSMQGRGTVSFEGGRVCRRAEKKVSTARED